MSLADALGPPRLSIDPSLVHAPQVNDPDVLNEDVDMDLFGDEAENKADEDVPQPPSEPADERARSASAEREERERLEYREDDDNEPQVVQQLNEQSLAIPDIPIPRTSDGKHWTIRLPNYVKLDSRPFAPEVYQGPEHDDDEPSQAEMSKERSMSIKLEVENTMRWRWVRGSSGEMERQSNSRFIRWSDGSLSLQLGKELFDVTSSLDQPAQPAANALQLSQDSQPLPASQRPSNLSFLVAQHPRAKILQVEAAVHGTLSIRPVSMQSEAHRKLVRAVGQKHNKVARLRIAQDMQHDPEREKAELMRLAAKKPRRPRVRDEDGGTPRRRRATGGRSRRNTDDMWSDEAEEFEGSDGGSEDDKRGHRKAKHRRDDDGDGGKGGDYQTDDFVVADSTDDDEAGGGPKQRKKRRRDDDDTMAPDELEEMEERLERQEAERKKHRPPAAKPSKKRAEDADDDAEDDMDVESEEPEDDDEAPSRVRKQSRRKALDFDENEEEND